MRSLNLAVVLSLMMLGCQQRKQSAAPPSSKVEEAANKAITILQKMVTDQNFRALGFESLDQVKQAQLGAPLQMFDIGLDKLKGYRAGTNADTLLTQSSKTVYPITVNGEVKSSVMINHNESGYQPSNFGNADIIKSLSRYRRADSGNDFIVRVPAFGIYYLGRHVENRLLLVPIISDPRLKVKTGEPVPAETVIEQLVPLANAYNELPM